MQENLFRKVWKGNKIVTRRVISEQFDGRNSGIVKVDISFRV